MRSNLNGYVAGLSNYPGKFARDRVSAQCANTIVKHMWRNHRSELEFLCHQHHSRDAPVFLEAIAIAKRYPAEYGSDVVKLLRSQLSRSLGRI